MDIRLKRAYEPASPADGYRVLIDRLWPRGLSKKQAKLDEWEKELSPSTELRAWFGHRPSRFPEFRRRYIGELRRKRQRLTGLRRRAREGTLTLVYSAHDTEHNDAVVLADVLRRGLPTSQTAVATTEAQGLKKDGSPGRPETPSDSTSCGRSREHD